jgi:dihydrofolate reductase
MSSLTIIVATDPLNGIGIDNKMPWHLPEDLAHFKKTTSGHAIIMGRKTFESIGRALPNRLNIVITRNAEWKQDGVECVTSLNAAQELAEKAGKTAYIIGGAQIYQQAMLQADTLIVTEIDKQFTCDAFFPEIKQQDWEEVAREKHFSEANQLNYAFVTYKKR